MSLGCYKTLSAKMALPNPETEPSFTWTQFIHTPQDRAPGASHRSGGPFVGRWPTEQPRGCGPLRAYGGHCRKRATICGVYQGTSADTLRLMQPAKNVAQ